MEKITALVRAKNGMRYFPRLIPQLRAIADTVLILDDHSTDGSYEYLRQIALTSQNFLVLQLADQTYNGGRDWNCLYDRLIDIKPDWIFCPDADELVEEPAQESIKRLVAQSGKDVLGWAFPFYYLWDDDQHYRNQGMYHNTKVIRLYRYDPALRPPNQTHHSTGVPNELDRRLIRVADVRMWHYGYMNAADRQAKYDFYMERDKGKDLSTIGVGADNYRHLIDPPTDLTPVPPLSEWLSPPMFTTGDFLLRRPARITIGGPFAASKELVSIDELDGAPDGCVDDARLFFVLDSLVCAQSVDVLQRVHRALRPGGRIEIVSVDFTRVCQHYIESNYEEKLNMQGRFWQTPRRQAVRTMYSDEILFQMLNDVGFRDPQRVPLNLLDFRMMTMAYKDGGDKWI